MPERAGVASATLTALPGSDSPLASKPPSGGTEQRFTPGTVLAGRYRLIARLGRGGMGEVYRADDLKLGTAVAVKFLPERLSLDASALARFHREVRVSRKVAHRNVCRVFDIGEVDGLHFLTMEYIDGEDLASLLLRIGRLPTAKAIELSHQLCAGLAAAHEVGILHRDLKPANVMIDGRGRAKITDFGLSHLIDELQSRGEVVGTPAYMAPEQLRGEPAGQPTDVFALGLVFYEMFTGAKAIEAEDWATLLGRGAQAMPIVPPSEHLPGLDPEVEEVLLSMLEHDPTHRAASALEVAANLPGGDPLAAALAAGETPSPEMVAAAPDRRAMSNRGALASALGVVLSLVIAHFLGNGTLLGMVDPAKEPVVLADRARQLLADLGWPDNAIDSKGLYQFETERIERSEADMDSLAAWRQRAEQRPMLLTYWYRQSPTGLLPWRVAWSPEPFDPPPSPGEAFVVLDARGRLEQLRLEAGEGHGTRGGPTGVAVPDWDRLFEAAELEPTRFRAIEPDLVEAQALLPAHDQRRAWVGTGADGEALRIEAASLGRWPVFFALGEGGVTVGPVAAEAPLPSGQAPLLITFFVLMGAALVLAHRHLTRGRADRRGAKVLGLGVAAVSFVGLLLGAHYPPTEDGFYLLLEILEATAFRGAAVVLVYLALEPLIRRRAPELLVTSTRLLVGRWSDPRVGRDLLAGLVLGAAAAAAYALADYPAQALGEGPLAIYGVGDKLDGVGGTVYWMTFSFFLQVSGSLLLCLLYALLFAWGHRRSWAAAGVWVVAATFGGFSVIAMVGALLFVTSLARFGILATVVAWTCIDWVLFFPTGARFGDWWLPQALLPSIVLVVLAFLAAQVATGSVQAARARWRNPSSRTGSRAARSSTALSRNT